jgi:hypothetical protein
MRGFGCCVLLGDLFVFFLGIVVMSLFRYLVSHLMYCTKQR